MKISSLAMSFCCDSSFVLLVNGFKVVNLILSAMVNDGYGFSSFWSVEVKPAQ